MPGTIHVSVLELVGLPAPPQSSSMGVKVSMGKQAHEMRDKEETCFSLASFRDNLSVSICDSEGNEIAHADVETRSIVEKGTWDDLFPLKDGGHIHMRLHFNLTEDELKRIRSMRESAARIKQEDLLKRSRSSSDLAGASGALHLHKIHSSLSIGLWREMWIPLTAKLTRYLLILMLKF